MADHPDFTAALRALHDEAAGVLGIQLFYAGDVAALIVEAAMGDAGARRYLQALETFERRIGRPGGPDCLTCGEPLAGKTQFGLILPARLDATRCLAIGLCEPCATGHHDRAGAQQSVLRALRRMAWLDLRRIAPPAGPAGTHDTAPP